ncbi:MAG TPA: cytochrome c biogenesis protein CcsA [Terriglobia bacterium]|nr:cytochrome c biogenesis protein CcsA [Terriglobia bacterium]
MNRKFPVWLHFVLTIGALVVTLYMIFLYAPEEMTMGEVQRIFYIHVPAAWVALLGFIIIFISSIVYLMKRSQPADELAHAAAEVGFIFCTCVLVTGPLWAKPAWGIWWTWDARLTLTFLLWLLYVAYLMLRSYLVNPGRAANLCAVVGVIGFVDVLIDYMAIRWWRTQHPQPVVLGGPQSGLDPRMLATLLVGVGAFTILFFLLVRVRLRLAVMRREISEIRHALAFKLSED